MLDKSLAFLMPVHVWWRLESQNLHRHQTNQKNQTTRCTKPAQAPKKPKKTKLWASTQGWGSIDYIFFLFFFDACAGFVKVMLCFFCFFWCLCMFGEDQSHKTCTGIKKTKKPKPLDEQNLHRHQKKQKKTKLWASTQGWWSIDYIFLFFFGFLMPVQVLWRSCFVFFGFFDACAGFVKIMLSFVCLFQCLRMFCQSLPRWKKWKSMRFTSISDPSGA